MICPHCGHELNETELYALFAALGGRHTSEAKARSSRENGKLGGRPRKDQKAGENKPSNRSGKPRRTR